MGAFFILLFWIVWFGIKWLDESPDPKLEECYAINHTLLLPGGDLKHCPPYGSLEKYEIMRDEISDDLRYIFGDDWRQETHRWCPVTSDSWDYSRFGVLKPDFQNSSEIVYKVWLSKYGYLCFYAYSGDYSLTVSGKSGKYRDIALRAYEVIERNLREAHPDLNLTLRVRVNEKTGEEMPDWLEWEHHQRGYRKKLGRRPW